MSGRKNHFPKNYHISSFHPTAYEDNVYSVGISRNDRPALDRYTDRTLLEAKNKRDAINKYLESRDYEMYRKNQERLDSMPNDSFAEQYATTYGECIESGGHWVVSHRRKGGIIVNGHCAKNPGRR